MEMAVESMEMALGQFPILEGYRNRDFCPLNLVFNGGGAAAELFMEGCQLI
jgi:hypothetical protein